MAHPIWTTVSIDGNKPKGVGAAFKRKETILIGKNAKDNFHFAEVQTTKIHKEMPEYGSVTIFALLFDGLVIKKAIFQNNNGELGELLDTLVNFPGE